MFKSKKLLSAFIISALFSAAIIMPTNSAMAQEVQPAPPEIEDVAVTNQLRTLENGTQIYATPGGGTIAVNPATGEYRDYNAQTREVGSTVLGTSDSLRVDNYIPPAQRGVSTATNQLRTLNDGTRIFATPTGAPIAVNPATGEYRSYDSQTGEIGTTVLGTDTTLRVDNYTPPVQTVSTLPPLTNRLRTLDNGLEVLATQTGGTVAYNPEAQTYYDVDEATGQYYEINQSTGAISGVAAGRDDVLATNPPPPTPTPASLLPTPASGSLRTLENGNQVLAAQGGGTVVYDSRTDSYYDVDQTTGQYFAIDEATGIVSGTPSGQSNSLVSMRATPVEFVDTSTGIRNRLRTLDNGLEVLSSEEGGLVAYDRGSGTYYSVDETTGQYYAMDNATGTVSTVASGQNDSLATQRVTTPIAAPNSVIGNYLRTNADGTQIYAAPSGGGRVEVDPATGTYTQYDRDNVAVSTGTDASLLVAGYTPPDNDSGGFNISGIRGVIGTADNGFQIRGTGDGVNFVVTDPETGNVFSYDPITQAIGLDILGQNGSFSLGTLGNTLRSLEITGQGANDSTYSIIADRNIGGALYALNTATGEYFAYDADTRTIDFSTSLGIDNARISTAGAPRARIGTQPITRRAAGVDGCDASGNDLAEVICNTLESFEGVPGLLSGFSYLCGLILGFMAVTKLREHVDSPNQVPIWDPIKRFIAGGAFFSLPAIVNVAYTTIVGPDGISVLAGDSRGFNTSGVSGGGLDAMIVNLMSNIWAPMNFLLTGFAWLAGLILIMIGISRLLKSEQEGARGPMGIGTIMTFLVAGVLLSLNNVLGAAVESIFQSGSMTYASLAYTTGMGGGEDHANAVIGAIMAFVAIVGWVSFIRGFFIMRGVAEGNSQASLMAGVTHILGGAIAVNLGGFISAVQNTLGISNFGLDFTSIEPYITSATMLA